MRQKIKLSFNIVYVIIGCILIGFSVLEKLDSFWSGMGSALLVVGLINLLKIHRLNKNEEYREKLEIEVSDERLQFIRNKAWAWSGYLFVLISAVACIVFKVMNLDQLSLYSSFSVCLVLALFWVSHAIIKRKY
ncbi:MAG: hypothetical protein IKU67_04635 [Firmicutes bacterium]|nr:hypothetical protein [Bacillota bacterium]